MRRALAVLCVAGGLSVLIAGCGLGSDHAQRLALAALTTKRPVPKSGKREPVVKCKNPYASLRPPATMPAPGAMPAGSYMARIKRRGYLRAGVDQNTLLFSYFDPQKRRFVGFEIDLLHQLSQAIFGNPDKVRFKAITTQERAQAVQDGSVDVVVDAYTITCYRKRQVDFSTVYYDAGQKILVPSNSPVTSIKDLGGRRVCATVGSTSIETLERQRPKPRAWGVPQRTDCLVRLQDGTVAAITSDDSILLGFKAQDPDTRIVGPSFAPEPYGMAVSKRHPGFVRFINGFLAQIRANGIWRATYKNWLGKVTSIPKPPPAQYTG